MYGRTQHRRDLCVCGVGMVGNGTWRVCILGAFMWALTLPTAMGVTPTSGAIVYSYYRWDAPTERSIRTLDLESDEVQALASGVGRRRSPTWSRDGSRIAYVEGGETDSIVLMRSDGSNPKTVSLGELRDVYDIDWSPDGRWIVFVARPVDQGQAGRLSPYLLDLVGGSVELITDAGGSDSHTSWSPDGSAILYTSDRSIVVLSPDGVVREKLTEPVWGGFPAWSPDGETIAFVAQGTHLFLMDAKGKSRRRIAAFENLRIGSLSWFPSGHKLLFSSTTGGIRRISRIDIDGSNYATVVETRDAYLGPPRAFGPDPVPSPPALMPVIWGAVRNDADQLGIVPTP